MPAAALTGMPLLGVLPDLARDPIAVFERARPLGEMVRLPVPDRRPLLLLTGPEGARHALQTRAAAYLRTRFHDRLKPVLGEGLVTSEGALWRRQRALLQPAFRAERVRGFVAGMGEEALALAARWERAEDAVTDVARDMSALALGIAVRALFGAEPRAEDAAIADAVGEAQAWISARFWSVAPCWTARLPTPANRRFRRALAALDAALDRIVAARLRRGEAGEDLLGLLLAAHAEGRAPDLRQLRDEAMTMLLAGHETTAAALAWTWHLLALHPAEAARLRDELAPLAGRAPAWEELGRLERTRAVANEAMRLYPPLGWTSRLAGERDRIAGVDIPAGSTLIVSPWLLHRDPRLWERPERFEPARFLAGAPRPAPYAHIPFGGGPRTCIGSHFALTEMVVALAVLAPRFAPEHIAAGGDVRPELLVTLRPRGGLPMLVRRA